MSRERTAGRVPAEEQESLWWLTASPALWAAHFLACYLTAALWCAKAAGAGAGSLGAAGVAIAAYTAAALAGIGVVGWRSWRRHRFGAATASHDFDTPEDRHRFLGFAALLLSGLSAVAVVYELLPLFFVGSCR